MDAMGDQFLAAASVAGRVCVGLVFLLVGPPCNLPWALLGREAARKLVLLGALAMPWAVLAAIALLAVFAAAMATNLRRGRSAIDCGCGQSFLAQTLSWTLVARNAVLAALLLPTLLLTGPPALSAVLTGTGAGTGFFLLYLLLNALVALPRPEARGHRFA